MRQVYILEKIDGKWALTVPGWSKLVNWAIRFNYRCESARIGDDISFVKITRK